MADLQDFIRSGKLQAGVTLSWKRRLTGTHTALIQSDGTIELEDGSRHKTPSGAAKHISGKPVDGWLAWKLPSGKPLGEIRG
jgi:hypothetical protein